jgi:hypothetical protein
MRAAARTAATASWCSRKLGQGTCMHICTVRRRSPLEKGAPQVDNVLVFFECTPRAATSPLAGHGGHFYSFLLEGL